MGPRDQEGFRNLFYVQLAVRQHSLIWPKRICCVCEVDIQNPLMTFRDTFMREEVWGFIGYSGALRSE